MTIIEWIANVAEELAQKQVPKDQWIVTLNKDEAKLLLQDIVNLYRGQGRNREAKSLSSVLLEGDPVAFIQESGFNVSGVEINAVETIH